MSLLYRAGALIRPATRLHAGAFPALRSHASKYSSVAVDASSNEIEHAEYKVRCDLAAAYRIAHNMGWSDLIYNHISVRVPGSSDDNPLFLLNPFGLGFEEVVASGLVTVDIAGNVVDKGSQTGVINKAGFVVHSAVHRARHDAQAVMHIHHPPTMAVSAMKCGLLPLTQDSCILGKISYHNYEGIAIDKKEIESLGRDCGETNRVMMLKNHGALTLGRSVGEMFLLMYYVVKSCESQVQAFSAGGIDAVHQIPQATRELVHKQATSFNAEVGKTEFEYLRRQLNNVSTEYMN